MTILQDVGFEIAYKIKKIFWRHRFILLPVAGVVDLPKK